MSPRLKLRGTVTSEAFVFKLHFLSSRCPESQPIIWWSRLFALAFPDWLFTLLWVIFSTFYPLFIRELLPSAFLISEKSLRFLFLSWSLEYFRGKWPINVTTWRWKLKALAFLQPQSPSKSFSFPSRKYEFSLDFFIQAPDLEINIFLCFSKLVVNLPAIVIFP